MGRDLALTGGWREYDYGVWISRVRLAGSPITPYLLVSRSFYRTMRNEVASFTTVQTATESTLCCRAADDKRALPTCMGSVSDPSAPLSPLRWSAEGYPRSSGANGPGTLRRKTKTSSPSASLATGTLPFSGRLSILVATSMRELMSLGNSLAASSSFISPDNP
ncbi:hypothetical protein DPEC_G00167240 [Dallia pectoralis]|uniref:Uncharacterized protein n=1 Tax=Dallia pectoralis TaxID=75939 RepID=A0ACC2GIB0_DALPE|nr:hypothetical protein DPEC_G00167240 [Dallia pectoralis]